MITISMRRKHTSWVFSLIMGIVDTNVLRISSKLKKVLVLRKIPRIDFLVFIFLLSKGPLIRLLGFLGSIMSS